MYHVRHACGVRHTQSQACLVGTKGFGNGGWWWEGNISWPEQENQKLNCIIQTVEVKRSSSYWGGEWEACRLWSIPNLGLGSWGGGWPLRTERSYIRLGESWLRKTVGGQGQDNWWMKTMRIFALVTQWMEGLGHARNCGMRFSFTMNFYKDFPPDLMKRRKY